MKPDTSFVLKSGHFHLLTTFPVGRFRLGGNAGRIACRYDATLESLLLRLIFT